jgi:hypothetical protein
VAIAYGAVLVFFVGLMGSLAVYLSKWGVAQTPFTRMVDREPSYLFAYAPTSFGWRELLLQGATTDQGAPLVNEVGAIDPGAYSHYVTSPSFKWYNQIGAALVSCVWVMLVFLFVIGFGYSYFWSSSTIIYLLLRRKIDDAEMDEIYLEEDDQEPSYTPSTPPAPSGAPSTPGMTMVEAPSLRPPTPAAPAAPAPVPEATPPSAAINETPPLEPVPPVGGEGNATPPGGSTP